MRRVPAARTVAKPLSRSTRRCWDTAGWEMPNSPPTTSTTSPEVCSPEASSSRIRRRTGSPSTSNACTSGVLGQWPPRVGRGGAGRRGAGGRRVVTGRDRRVAPGLAAAGQEGDTLVGGGPRGGLRGVAEAAGCARPELGPPLGRDVRGVPELQGGVVAVRGERDGDPRDVAPELPGDGER